MQGKQVYIASASEQAQPQHSWDAIYSAQTLRSALRRLLPRTMLGNRECVSLNGAPDARGSHLNELDDAAGSSRSSFEDIWDSTSIEIRDASYHRGDYNATTSLLLTCKSQVIYPYFYLLSLVAWRPFPIHSFHYQGCSVRKILNILYTMFIFLLIIFSYGSSIMACQARFVIKKENPIVTSIPVKTIKLHPTTHTNITTAHLRSTTDETATASPPNTTIPSVTISKNNSLPTTPPSNSKNLKSTTSVPLVYKNATTNESSVIPFLTLAPPAVWKPAVTECTHIFSTYVVPNILHFLAFFIGFYLFRIQENEGLNALIEKVFLLTSFPKKIVSRLRFFLFGGFCMVFLGVGNFIWFCHAYSLASVTGFKFSISAQWTVACLMVLGKVVEFCVSIVTLLNYCAQCELLVFFLREIGIRMEEKTTDLNIIMKDVLEVKKNLTRINGFISVIATLIIFSYFERGVIGVVNLALYSSVIETKSELAYRALSPIINFAMVTLPIVKAVRFTSEARMFKQKCLQIRVFGYPSASQLDLDSFMLFSHSADMKAKLMFMPVQASYLAAVVALLVFVLLLLLQTDVIADGNQYF